MESIHVKTVDPLSKELLGEAARRGLSLNWERYEKQQPQDGFLRLGLSCPYGCLQGPCRIDPFGRGAQSGICGLSRDGMVAAQLLRLSLQGSLENLSLAPSVSPCGEIVWPASLQERGCAAAQALGGAASMEGEILAGAALLARPAASPERLLRQSLRLALFTAGMIGGGGGKYPAGGAACRVGYGLLAGEAPVAALCGRPDAAFVETLVRAAAAGSPPVRLVSLGDWIPGDNGFIPIVCTSGEAETVLSSGKLNLLIAGPGADPGVLTLCRKLQIPVLSGDDGFSAESILQQARSVFEKRGAGAFSPDEALVAEGVVNSAGAAIAAALASGPAGKIALMGGADSLFGSLGHIPVELARGLRGQDIEIGAWSDAAVWMLKQDVPVALLEAQRGPLLAVSALAAAGRLSALQGVCFTGLKSCGELTLALGLAALGIRVSLGTPIPLWGSERICSLLREELAALGGSLTHFDHPAQADELLDWFTRA
ncbi:MAG: hypothetical protein ACYC6Q_11145 [Syntrophales bacterium]